MEHIEEERKKLEKSVAEFDLKWVTYEKLYVNELMVIENDARRFVAEAIKIEKQM